MLSKKTSSKTATVSATPSTMLPLGTPLPTFALFDVVSGRTVNSSELAASRGVLVAFICNHCPFVVHVRSALIALAHRAIDQGFSVVMINSNSIKSHPQDGPENMKALATKEQWRFPFLFDETQEVARAFQAACTPDFFLFDSKKTLAYRGQFDDSRPNNGKPVTGADLQSAIDALTQGKAPGADQRASIGCNIKWNA